MIEIPAWGTATVVEILWTIPALVGIVYCAINLSHATAERKLLEPADEGGRILTGAQVRAERVRLAVMTGFALVGIMAMIQPSSTGRNVTTITGLVLTIVFLAAELGLVFNSYLDRRDRDRFVATL